MFPSAGRVGYPVAKTRLFMSIIAGVFFGFLLFMASVYLKWFTAIRGFYLVLGVVEGLVIGRLQARIVINNLIGDTETMAWQILPISTVFVGLPFLLAITIFGEYFPLMAYLVLSFIPVYLATTGWYFNEFEKKKKVRILTSPYGVKYWTEPILDVSERFYHFIRDVASKDVSSLWRHVGYSKKFSTKLEERQDFEPSTREALNNILKTMNKYRRMGLAILSMFVASGSGLLVFLFVNMFGLVRIADYVVVNIVGPASGCILFGFFISVWYLLRGFNKRISGMMARIDSDQLSSV
jgi:hypothetical protein